MTQYFKILNAMPSFDSEYRRVEGGQTFANPYPNYGKFVASGGKDKFLEDYFYHAMRETPAGGSDKLAVYLNTQAGMTTMVASGLTGLRNYIFTQFGATANTVGYGLLDFRGSTSWNILTGDGIIGPSNPGSTAATQTQTAAAAILTYLKANTGIKWTYAGLPYLPHVTTYAPNSGTAHSWNTGLTNNGVTGTNFWDNDHPTGGDMYNMLYLWYSTPSNLKDYYKAKSLDSVLGVLDASDWLCPDINPIHDPLGISRNWYSVEQARAYTRDVMDVCNTYADYRFSIEGNYERIEVYPLINTTYRSRNVGHNDNEYSYFRNETQVQIVDGDSNLVQEVSVIYGFTGSTAGMSDIIINEAMFKSGMVTPAANKMCSGFVYLDQIPFLIDLACTGNETDVTRQVAQTRARNFIRREVYDDNRESIPNIGTYWPLRKNEIRSYLAFNQAAERLRFISESIPVGDPNWNSMSDTINDGGDSEGVTSFAAWRWINIGNHDIQTYSDLVNNVNSCCTPPTEICCRIGSGGVCGTCEPVRSGTCESLGGFVVDTCEDCVDPSNKVGYCCLNFQCVPNFRQCDCLAANGKWFDSGSACQNSGCESVPPPPIDQLSSGVIEYKLPADFEFTSETFQIPARNVTEIANNDTYFLSLPINNSYLTSELNFRYNSPATAETIQRIKSQVSNDLAFIKYTYIP